jgi:hypothetical protein
LQIASPWAMSCDLVSWAAVLVVELLPPPPHAPTPVAITAAITPVPMSRRRVRADIGGQRSDRLK